ncbi:hypothetical protein [Sphingomonas sp.]|uniref:hypothetical protein n=1 Tax=Sphingomonas sp. TaxID=28214 RepID=UPI0028AC2D14|nr:hypothetical protein [Sphingomonas sp.]
MRGLAYLLPLLLAGAAPAGPVAVPLDAFQTWGIRPAVPVSFVAGGVTVEVAATPCQVPGQNEGCTSEGVSNQAVISVTQPGLPTFRMTSNAQASFVRVAVLRLGPGGGRAGIVVDNQWGGSGGFTAVTVIEPVAGGFRAVPLTYHGGTELVGEVRMVSRHLLRDGRPAFLLETFGFHFTGECNACTRGVPLVLTVRDGRSEDISGDPALRPLFARDLPAHRRICLSTTGERNGHCAAFVADAARLGQVATAWRLMLAHYRPDATAFPAALRSLLVSEGYITPAEARQLQSQ